MHACMHVCVRVWFMHVCMHMCIHACASGCMGVCMCASAHIYQNMSPLINSLSCIKASYREKDEVS